MELEKALEVFFKFWRLIYNMNKNKVDEVLESDTLKRLIEEIKKEENKFHLNLIEHMDIANSTKEMIIPMKATEMKDEDLKEKLRKLKNNKPAGTDKLKVELFKELGKRGTCR